ncbi:bifunctional diguanylate cyclase/phosphodiesterase [Sideroxydans lithotrophicus]|uniref:Diguanylate cyclase/phosphodiesterase with PAS/PAC sensor(S) n=1 Tax=Sideroxydans lithotrophicus (strain ES-1) TaxID=580332 RepID=D5CTU0_SIDLE|nr:EAL domain-containing protein [Sideroxydans lithotrophicus]ADE12252.1 diguanylate cyclase/phosphodiesterase with PAS/PAC sensor(s) [Sideroxydans lithotrophicus ES-1]
MIAPIRVRKIAMLVTLLSLVATGFYWWQLSKAGDQLRSETLAQAELRARQLNDSVAQQVAILIRYVDFAAQELGETYIDGKLSEFRKQVDEVEERFPEQSLLQIAVIDAQGYLAYSNLGMKERVYLGDREHFKAHLGSDKTQLFVSAPVLGRVSRQWSIQFTRPLLRHGRFAGVIVLSLSPEYLHKTLRELSLGREDSIAIFRQSGEYLARNVDNEIALGKAVGPRPFLGPDAPSGGLFKSKAYFDNVVRLFQWRRLSDAPVVVVLGLSETALLKPVDAIIHKNRWQAGIATALLWLLTLGAILLLQRLSSQQKLIVRHAQRLQATSNDLQESEKRLRTIFETEPECIKVVDRNGELVEMNQAGLAMLEAATLEEARQKKLIDYVAPEDQAAFLALHRRVMNGESAVLEFKITGLKGTLHHLETHATPMPDANGNISLLLGITRDVTASMHAKQQLRIAATAFESQEGMLVTDAVGAILRVNQAFTRITGYTADEVIGKNPRILNSGRHDAYFYKEMWERIKRTGEWEGEIWNRRKNGDVYPEHLTITAVKDAGGNVVNYVATLMDITASKASEEEIRNLAFFDPLTRLPNRRLLQDRLQQALASCGRSGKSGAILFIDLDNFKNLNDTLGHDIGDLLLEKVAIRLSSCVREGDTVARIGGDEFVVMLEDLSDNILDAAEQTESVGSKILASLNVPYQLGIHTYDNSPSIGATLFNDNHNSIDELLKQADIAMYQAKKAGRNTMRFFDPRMQQSLSARLALELELRKAIEKDQFQLYYQIQVDETHRPLGAEALLRWMHPEHGLMAPAEFIPMAEETGLIVPIGWWVLETACTQLKAWEKDPLTRNLVLSINVSAKQFHQPDFVDQVQAAVDHYGIDPALLKLELTESILLENVDTTIKRMSALKKTGVGFSLDDFGTGYSSLQYLKRLPLDQLKIDQSFMQEITSDSSDMAIVSTIIAMAQSMQMGVIAEGVETEEQRQLLLRKGCNHFQGYLFSKPVPVEQFEKLLHRG